MDNLTFTVDTHLFRELGQLLVGRDSTALIELIKNSYDADAKKVIVYGEKLDDQSLGRIVITDDGVGMTLEQFEKGFLRIASRIKDDGTRHSPLFNRRYTGAKGIGRLAAHKLSRLIQIESTPTTEISQDNSPISATIDWDLVESLPTLDDLKGAKAVKANRIIGSSNSKPGTIIILQKLRRKWSSAERARFFAEVQTFSPPALLINISSSVINKNLLLFDLPKVRDSKGSDPGFSIELTGELEAGEEYWQNLGQAAQWLIEIEARNIDSKVEFNIIPTKKGIMSFPDAIRQTYTIAHPDPKNGPFFQARIFIREGVSKAKKDEAVWLGRSNGVRVYMEGFRVLPYGEPSDDWLSIDATYTSRTKTLKFLSDLELGESSDNNEGLIYLRNSSYFGAVFLTVDGSPSLQMLVNREGFVPEQGYSNLVDLVRIGIDLSVRVRAAAKSQSREERRDQRINQTIYVNSIVDDSRLKLREAVESSVKRANEYAIEARKLAAIGDIESAQKMITEAAEEFSIGAKISERLMTEGMLLRVLASVGTQMTAFVHEINGILGSAIALEGAITRIRENEGISSSIRGRLGQLQGAISDLRRSVERQASYLTDIISPDARRRRARQKLSERFDAAKRLVEQSALRQEIEILNEIPVELKSPPMFMAELTVVFSNLLTNAIKAAGIGGRIKASGEKLNEAITVTVQNTGVEVKPQAGEKWFQPFESTTVETDPILGQGMGMGLTITRNMLEEYGATIEFTNPSEGYATSLKIILPN